MNRSGYDQWLEHDPAQDHIELADGIPGHDAECPACGETAEWSDGEVIDEIGVGPGGWYCETCGWLQDADDDDYARADGRPRDGE